MSEPAVKSKWQKPRHKVYLVELSQKHLNVKSVRLEGTNHVLVVVVRSISSVMGRCRVSQLIRQLADDIPLPDCYR